MATSVIGREAELVAVDRLLDSARRSLAALVLEGDAGIGKTTMWREGISRAADARYRVLSGRAAQSEARFSFTALGDLLAPVQPALFATLPDPQRRALDAALLRAESAGAAPNPRAIGTAIVSLLSQLAATSPLLLAIDDLQWLDIPSARALEFALRRLHAQPIAVLATVRLGERSNVDVLRSLAVDKRVTTQRVGPLSLGALYRIIEDELGHALPRPLLVRIERACGGNPFYALEIARALATAGTSATTPDLPIPDDLRELVSKRLRKLPRRTRDALLRVSALATPTIGSVAPADLAPAEEAGVVRVRDDGRIEFSHPLFASAVYAAASHERRQRLHAELAEIASDIEERARHLMYARSGKEVDDHVADVLHDAAEHALRRGAVEVAADLDEQSARRTSDRQSEVRWLRYLRSARHHLKAGDPGRSRALCEEVLRASAPSSVRAHALHILAESWAAERPEAAIPLLEQALACVGDDLAHAARLEMAVGTMLAAVFDLARLDRHLVSAVTLAEQAGDTALLAEAIALKANAGLLLGQGLDERALTRALALEDIDREVPFQMRASLNVAIAYQFSGRVDLAHPLLVKLREHLAARGDEADLAWVLCHLAATAWLAGNLTVAEREADEAERVAELNGVEIFRAFALMLRTMIRALRGNADGARADGAEGVALSDRIEWPVGSSQSRWGLGFLALSEGDPAAAVAILDPVIAQVEALAVYEWPIAMPLPDTIEALVATGEIERATRLTGALANCGRTFDRPWALATSGRCRALLLAAAGDIDAAVAATAQALIEHERLPMPFEFGRTLLVHGQLLRRGGERRAAREALQRALTIFEEIGAPLWAEKARTEIARIGVRRAPDELTEGEERVAKLAAQGLTNPDIAARLFMSRRTVEANLARAYAKLGIHSRAELGAVMAKRDDTGSA